MKSFSRIFAAVLIAIAAIFLVTNIYLGKSENERSRQYRVDAERIAYDISSKGIENLDLSGYDTIIQVVKLNGDDEKSFFEGKKYEYIIKIIDGEYYRFDYNGGDDDVREKARVILNVSLGVMAAVMTGVLLFVQISLLKPFNRLKEVPYELSKGNLTIPIKESKSRFFGRFLWGMDLLRENLEKQKLTELELQKDKKTLILSISHDIKTPLSAIKLYAKALSKNLYDSPEKQVEIAENINAKADEIEEFVTQIIRASKEDFLKLTVVESEFYMSEVINKISDYYREKLGLLKIDFEAEPYTDCVLKGDADRAVEVVQNIMENAVKYGNGHFIHMDFSDEEDCRLITISNGGCTMSESEFPHIFDSFFRGSNVGNNGGSGLGLYICRQLMNKMGGEIFVKGEGDIIRFTLVFQKA